MIESVILLFKSYCLRFKLLAFLHAARWVQMIGVGLLLCACQSQPDVSADSRVMVVDSAMALSSDDSTSPPADTNDWFKITLPDNWDDSRPGRGGGVWYRVEIDVPEDASEAIMVLLPNFSMNASIWWDGHQVATGGRMTEPVARNWHNPLAAHIASSQAHQGKHWLHIYVRGYPNDASGLGRFFVGPESLLDKLYANRVFVLKTLSLLALFGAMAVGLIFLSLWVLQRQYHSLVWLSVASFSWSLVLCDFVVQTPPLSRFYWEVIYQSGIELFSFSLMVVAFRLLDRYKPITERLIGLYYVLGWGIILLFGTDADVMDWAMPLHTVAILASCYTIVISLRSWWQNRHGNALAIAGSLGMLLLFSIHDWWVVYLSNQLDQVLSVQIGSVLVLLSLGLWMIYRLSQGMSMREAYTASIEAEVERVKGELEHEQQQKERLLQEQVQNQERDRFAREMHDGLGGHLVCLSNMLRDPQCDESQMRGLVDLAMLEMRLIVEGADEQSRNVGMMIGMLRHRIEPLMCSWGVKIKWDISALPWDCMVTREQGMHLLRIVQESLINAARHADADRVVVRAAKVVNGAVSLLCLEVRDNGRGWEELPSSSGRGLKNMRNRAAMIGAKLDISGQLGCGVRVTLELPLAEMD